METKLDYELVIKGRKADIGSKLWLDKGDKNIYSVSIDKISIGDAEYPQVRLMSDEYEFTFFNIDDSRFIEECLFWEKPIIYQLPDTDGNLSEIKVGQDVWLKYNNGRIYRCIISEFSGSDIEIMDICDNGRVYASNKEGLTFAGGRVTTNKPIIYQLPDIEGNLSEVKIGQKIYNNIAFEPLHITRLWNGLIECSDDKGEIRVFSVNINNRKKVPIYTTNKPKRDFRPYFDFNQAPDGYDFGAVNRSGYAFWYTKKPFVEEEYDWWTGDGYGACAAGFRQNLINPETGFVDDWEDSLVERPKNV